VVTGLSVFPDMIIVTFDIDRDAETGADLNFKMRFQSLKIVKSEEVEISFSPTPEASDMVAPVVNLGMSGKEKIEFPMETKEQWLRLHYETGGNFPTEADFYEKWGEYPKRK
jgi:hypothetical protein